VSLRPLAGRIAVALGEQPAAERDMAALAWNAKAQSIHTPEPETVAP